VTVLHIVDQDTDGELIGRPAEWESEKPVPLIILAPYPGSARRTAPALGIGDRVLARLKKESDGSYEARVMKRLSQSAHKILGVFRTRLGDKDARVAPVDRRIRHELVVTTANTNGAKDNNLVTVEILSERHYGPKRARVVEVHGTIDDQCSVSLIAIHSHGIPTGFSQEELDESARARRARLSQRTDLRNIPLVTIDPADARDYDDAVSAVPDKNKANKGGWVVHVAIADVAHYVRPGSALDRGARVKGNSCYFPDRVVPMLPERLSNDLCSLRAEVERPCLAVRMVFDKEGNKRQHKFVRGLMRSQARLSYQQAQNAVDGNCDEITKPIAKTILKPLWQAYETLAKARTRRAPLELELSEHRITLAEDGSITGIKQKERLGTHRLVEEFMIQANVCAAETLEAKGMPLIYRVHEPPAEDKLAALHDFLKTIGLKLASGQMLKSRNFNAILNKTRGSGHADLVSDVVLRTQSQAVYSAKNLGHFGLNLRRYAHFTSPIRRYADLIVHRALIRALKLGHDGLSDEEIDTLEETAEVISNHERRAMAAERDSTDRFIAAFLSEHVGTIFDARISGVTRFGLFVRLNETGADGIVPMRALSDDHYHHDDKRHALVGRHNGGLYRLGQSVSVRLEEATPLTGGLRFDVLTPPEYAKKTETKRTPRGKSKLPKRRKKSHR
jgi:ribonuclease R